MRHLQPAGLAIWLGLVSAGAQSLGAQGVTGAAIQGTIRSADSAAVEGATVLVTNTATGERRQTTASASGRFFLEHLAVGGPYRIEVGAIGFASAREDGVVLSLGERHTIGFTLRAEAVELAEVTVQAAVDPRINAGRTGPAQLISDSTILRLPSARDYTNVAQLAPQVNFGQTAISFGGQPDRINGFQVDGTNNGDLFNSQFTGNGTIAGFPDDRTAPTPESIAAVEVVTAPFDVRYGNFAGGMVNAVTKSGSNHLTGVTYGYFEDQGLSGQQPSGGRPPGFGQGEAGLSVGGPIIRDRLAFFVDASFRRRGDAQAVPDPRPDTTGAVDSVVGIGYASAVRFRDILRNQYRVDPGDFESKDGHTPSGSVFAKLTAQLGVNSRLDVSHNFFRGAFDFEGAHDQGLLRFSSMAGHLPVTVNATRLGWTAGLGRRATNELLLGRVHESNECTPRSTFPGVQVTVDGGGSIEAGSAPGCGGSKDAETSWELTDNLGLIQGPHHWTFGMHHELLHLQTALRKPDAGVWSFDGLDALEQGTASRYERTLPGPLAPHGPRADFPVRQIGFYLQDQWAPTARLTVTAGIRLDVPFLPTTPPQNPDLVLSPLAINTAVTPNGHGLWSPRLGLSYDLSGRGTTFLRGGIGLFAGRPAYIWFREAFFNTGLQQLSLVCEGAEVPPFTPDPAQQPTRCANLQEAVPVIASFDPDFRFPRSLKVTVGGDHRFPWGVVGTVDLLYARGMSQLAVRNANLGLSTGVAAGEGNRAEYGGIDPTTGMAEPNFRDPAFGPVIEMFNRSGDRAWSLALQLQKRFANGTELDAAYAYTDARDRQSTPFDGAVDNLSVSPLDGTWTRQNLRSSLYSRPQKITATGTFDLPLQLRLGLSYLGTSGDPLTYVVSGDANADGLDNDPVYLPKSADDITLADPADYPRLDGVLRREPCLRRQRGRVQERNSCRQPWTNFLDARLSKLLPTAHGQSLELLADVFNLLHLLDRDWGLARFTSSQDAGPAEAHLLKLVGYDRERGRGVYTLVLPQFREIDQGLSRWRVRLSARYTF